MTRVGCPCKGAPIPLHAEKVSESMVPFVNPKDCKAQAEERKAKAEAFAQGIRDGSISEAAMAAIVESFCVKVVTKGGD